MEIFFLVFAVLGGLALFIFGMNVMTDGLRRAAGQKLRSILHGATRSRMAGMGLGTLLGTLVHSSATTVMLVGFVNAGLMSLAQTVPAMLGANVGTTVSMQLISFKLGAYCYFAIAVGFILKMAARKEQTRFIGQAIMGFGLLFLGMNTMSEAIKPHRAALAPFLEGVDGSTLQGMLTGIAIAAALTAIWQSSGATIAICFALIQAGVFTQLVQVYPIVLGAHIGTCATALLGSIGTNIEAKRSAYSHLFFNIFNVALAVAAAEYFLKYIPFTSSDLVRQTANLHTAVMIVAAALVLPIAPVHAWLVRLIVRSRKPPPPPSFLDAKLLDRPEQAIVAIIRELQRIARICSESLGLSADLILMEKSPRHLQQVKLNERVVNEIKLALKDYLASLTKHYLSRRQAVLIQHLDRCMIDIERIGDHIEALSDLSLRRRAEPQALFDEESLTVLFDLYKSARKVLDLVIASLDPEHTEFASMAEKIMKARDAYVDASIDAKSAYNEKVSKKKASPIAGVFYSEYVAAFDRIVRHSKTIALVESQPQFWIKRKKLDRIVADAPGVEAPKRIDPHDFLDKLHLEDYL